MPRLTFAGQIDHPALMKLERAEEKADIVVMPPQKTFESAEVSDPTSFEPPPREAPKDDGWIEWKGGPNPIIDGQSFEYRLEVGLQNRAFSLVKEYNLMFEHKSGENNIIAYRLVEPRK